MSTLASSKELNETFGVLLIGFVFVASLYGLTFFQTYLYFSRFPSDPAVSRYAVGLLWAFDTITTVLISYTVYIYLIVNFLEPFNQLTVTNAFVAERALAAFGIFVVHIFYALRIREATRNNLTIPTLIFSIALAALALGIAGTAQMSKQMLFCDIVTPITRVVVGLQYGVNSLCDLIIVVALFYLLQPERHARRTMPSNLFDFSVIHFFNRGTCFTMLEITSLVVFVVMPIHQVWLFFHFITSKVYINSLLAMLNFRGSREGRGFNEEDSASVRDSKSSAPGPAERGVQLGGVDTETKRAAAMTLELEPVQSRDGVDDEDEEAHKSDVQVLERVPRKSGSAY